MKLTHLLIIYSILVISCKTKQDGENDLPIKELASIPQAIDFNNMDTSGVFTTSEQTFIPDSNGIIAEIALQLPEYNKGMYYRPFSEELASGNRMEALWFDDVSELTNYKHQIPREDDNIKLGSFMLLQKKSGNYLAILPIVSKMVGNTFDVTNSGFILKMATYGTEAIEAKAPLLAYAESSNPYEATRMAWALAKEAEGVKGNVNWRSDKEYPEAFKYLGWCSWEHYKKDISEEVIIHAINDIKSSELPIRWVLVDDGYLDEEKGRLLSFGVDQSKFPNGWKPITDLKDDKIKWMGIWRNFNGYMVGVSPENNMTKLAGHLRLVPQEYRNRTLMAAKNSPESANAFYDAMTTDTKENGFDIIKVDFQSVNLLINRGTENPVLSVHHNNRALEENVKEKNLQLINCIAMQNFNVFNQTYSNIIRSSVDYKTNVDRIDLTIVQNFTNAFWLGHVHWLDQDMFHISYKETARLMAVSRAISGGPIYLSDETQNIDDTYLKPLMYEDGKIIGTLAPGVPLPESLLYDPYVDQEAFKVIAPLQNKSTSIMAVNLNRDLIVKSAISLKDYPNAAAMIQPREGLWEIPKEGVLLYDSYNNTAQKLTKDFEFELKTREERLFQLSPIIEGWSVIGRSDKYLSAAALEIKSISKDEIICKLKESGPLTIWSENGLPAIEGRPLKSLGNNLYLSEMPVVTGEIEIIITR